MSNVNVDTDTKQRFNDLQPDDHTQDEFVEVLLDAYEQHGRGVDPEDWADRVAEHISGTVANEVELAVYRAVRDQP